jgi:predicted amidophosphoribosyltransferase
MSPQPARRKKNSQKRRSYAGPTICLRCDNVFESWDRRQNRLCPACRQAVETQSSDEPSHSIHTPRRQPRGPDDR